MFSIQSLEQRSLLSVSLANGVLKITGGNSRDMFAVSADSGEIIVEDQSAQKQWRFASSKVKSIAADLKGGDDYILFDSAAVTKPFSVDGGSGKDTERYDGNNFSGTIYVGKNVEEFDAPQGNPHVIGNELNNLIYAYPGSGNPTLEGGLGNDTLVAGKGFTYMFGGKGDDTYRFPAWGTSSYSQVQVNEKSSEGTDTLDFSTLDKSINVNLMSSNAAIAHASVLDVYTRQMGEGRNFENIIGTKFNDTLVGNNARNRIEGLAGNDTITGNGSRDVLLGGSGNDVIYGKDGDKDTIDGGSGNDKATRDKSGALADVISSIETFI